MTPRPTGADVTALVTNVPVSRVVTTDVLVVGSGIAGLTAALELRRRAPDLRVLVATKALHGGATGWAQGGIAAVVPTARGTRRADGTEADSVAAHVADTLAAGDGLCVPDAVALLCAQGAAAVAALCARGLVLDRDVRTGDLARGLEAAHSHRRVLHAGGDVTGAHVAAALTAAVHAAAVPVLDAAALAQLRTDAQGRVRGALLLTPQGAVSVDAEAVVLATGGYAQVYAHSTTPSGATGDGLAAAARAGALLTDVEMVQFHPTLAAPAVGAATGAVTGRPHRFLVSEAVRGEGAVLRDEHGRRFLADGPLADPRAELAPRDVVARAMAAAMAGQDGRPVLLDATALEARLPGGLAGRFPGIDALCRAVGLDWRRDGVPVTPAAHYAMGGVLTDTWGRTSVPGLWAAGEVAATGVHGANRLASNSLLEGAVFAARAAADVVAALSGPALSGPALSGPALTGPATSVDRPLPTAAGHTVLTVDVAGPPLPRAHVGELLWTHAGLLREDAGLELAAKALDPSGGRFTGPVESAAVDVAAVDAAAVEDANLTLVARLLVTSARARRESRGAHARTDYPGRDAQARHLTVRAAR